MHELNIFALINYSVRSFLLIMTLIRHLLRADTKQTLRWDQGLFQTFNSYLSDEDEEEDAEVSLLWLQDSDEIKVQHLN